MCFVWTESGVEDVEIVNYHLSYDQETATPHAGDSHRTALHAFYRRRDKPQQQYQKQLLRPTVQASLSADLRHLLALDEPLNAEFAKSNVARTGFVPEHPRAY